MPLRVPCLLAALTAVLAACERGANEGADGAAAGAGTQAQRPKDPLADMVSAVSSSRTSAPVELKFHLGQRPIVGELVEIEIAVLPVSPLDRIQATFQAGAGLELRSGDQMAAVSRPEPGVALHHRITLVAHRDGIFFVSAVVLADSPQQSIARTFSIPIIATKVQPKAEKASATAREKPKSR